MHDYTVTYKNVRFRTTKVEKRQHCGSGIATSESTHALGRRRNMGRDSWVCVPNVELARFPESENEHGLERHIRSLGDVRTSLPVRRWNWTTTRRAVSIPIPAALSSSKYRVHLEGRCLLSWVAGERIKIAWADLVERTCILLSKPAVEGPVLSRVLPGVTQSWYQNATEE